MTGQFYVRMHTFTHVSHIYDARIYISWDDCSCPITTLQATVACCENFLILSPAYEHFFGVCRLVYGGMGIGKGVWAGLRGGGVEEGGEGCLQAALFFAG